MKSSTRCTLLAWNASSAMMHHQLCECWMTVYSQCLVLPPLPSPLLCPHRTFLASLILASKFMQDKCYSNCAWAKLTGLPAREIGRCERALGEALGWRLRVGKMSGFCMLPRSQRVGEVSRANSGNTVMSDAPSPGANAVRRSHMLPAHAFLFLTMATQPVNPAASRMQGPWIVNTNARGYSV